MSPCDPTVYFPHPLFRPVLATCTINNSNKHSRLMPHIGRSSRVLMQSGSSPCCSLRGMSGRLRRLAMSTHSLSYAKRSPSRLTRPAKPSAGECSCPRSSLCLRQQQLPRQLPHRNPPLSSISHCPAQVSSRLWPCSRPSTMIPPAPTFASNMSTSAPGPSEMPMLWLQLPAT